MSDPDALTVSEFSCPLLSGEIVVTPIVNDLDVLTHPTAFFTVRFPVYVPTAVFAGTLMVMGLIGNVASVTGTKLFEGKAFQVIL